MLVFRKQTSEARTTLQHSKKTLPFKQVLMTECKINSREVMELVLPLSAHSFPLKSMCLLVFMNL